MLVSIERHCIMYGWRSALESWSLAPLNSTVGISFTFRLPFLMEMSSILNQGCISSLAEKKTVGLGGKALSFLVLSHSGIMLPSGLCLLGLPNNAVSRTRGPKEIRHKYSQMHEIILSSCSAGLRGALCKSQILISM